MSVPVTVLVPILAGILALGFGGYFIVGILRMDSGTAQMREISLAIQEGAAAYLKRQYTTIAVVAAILFIILAVALNLTTAVFFLVGALASAAAGFIGMNVSVRANVRTAESAKRGLAAAMGVAVRGGAVTGLAVVGLGILALGILTELSPRPGGIFDPNALIGLGFGASLISVFARLGGGIFTKAADVGADLVGKVEAGIPEDDPRNPAVIADNVGDNVGDDAGMAADLFETFIVTTVAAMLLGHLQFRESSMNIIWYPVWIGAMGVVASIIGVFAIRAPRNGDGIMRSLYQGVFAASIVAAIGFFFVTRHLLSSVPGVDWSSVYIASLVGLVVTILLMFTTDYYTSARFSPVQGIARASVTGSGTNIIAGLSVGLRSTAIPVVVIVAGTLIAFAASGLYGIAVAAMGMLSLTAVIVTVDAFGPITDNAGGIAEMAHMDDSVRDVTDALDSVGNTTKAVTKGYAIGSAGLAALALFAAFVAEVPKSVGATFSLDDPRVVAGLFLGGILPALFTALAMEAVGRAAGAVVEEVRRQFREKPGIMAGTERPDYARAVSIVTKAALREMALPAAITVLAPIVVGVLLGPRALGGLLMGAIVTGIFQAIQMTTGGGAWDNAKKLIEAGKLLGPDGVAYQKGSFTHQAAITGDTVGDPYKDTAGPAINPMIKVINIVALLIVPFLGRGLL